MNRNRVFWAAMALTVLYCCNGLLAQATLTVGASSGVARIPTYPDHTASMPIRIADAGGANTATFTIEWNASLAALEAVTAGAAASGASANPTPGSPGTATVTVSGGGAFGAGELVLLTWKTVTTSSHVGAPMPISLSGATTAVGAGTPLTANTVAGSLEFAARTDTNLDGTTNVVDVQSGVNIILSTTTPAYPRQGDANGDGNVNVVDVQNIVNRILSGTGPLTLTTLSVPGGTVGVPYSFSFSASGGTIPYSFAATGQPIPGLSLSAAGQLSGTPTLDGQFQYTVQVTDNASATDQQTYTVVIAAPALQSVAVSASGGATLDHLTTKQLTATGTYNNSATANITQEVNWTTSNPNVATVGLTTGIVTGVAPGSATITATHPNNPAITDAILVTVVKVFTSVSISPNPASVIRLMTVQFTATAHFSDNTTQDVTSNSSWLSSSTAIATVTQLGVATGQAAGTTNISATRNIGGVAHSGMVQLTVQQEQLTGITVTPNPGSVQAGNTLGFTAAGTFNNGQSSPNVNAQVTWSSSNTNFATISSSGVASGVAAGTVTITATRIGGGVSGSAQLTVTAPAGVSYATQIQPIFNQRCTSCHSQFGANGGLQLQNYTAATTTGNNPNNIVPFNANGSNLYQRVLSNNMPQGGPALTSTQKQLIQDWINQGALNN